jgi:hypothetical protein
MDAAGGGAPDARAQGRRMSEAATLLRDLIEIPERVQTNDFVLRLSEGVSEEGAAATLSTYVVTPQLAKAFDHALGFIQGAVEKHASAASYLHGSFGSGKSHFMAVLDLLLAGNAKARAIAELAGLVNRHDRWLQGKRFLMVPFHLIGARDVESAILGGYADFVRRMHPDAPTPGFYLGERLFEDARRLLGRMGEEAFFGALNAASSEGDGWGDLGAAWDGGSFEAATLEGPAGEERQRLVGDLIGTFFSGYADVATARGEAFVDLDNGLAIMSQHAQRLGYDAVILFLDELILWLATRAGDVDFVSAEGAKLSKLVEAQRADRPIPIVSFVARQRDLRELIGAHHAGALEVRFIDTLKYWEARFDQINLEDRNLPVIAERRLLKPKSEAARQEVDTAFEGFADRRRDVVETLLGSDGERALFRMTYPFSPALVQALIAASSVLQRERTALRLMLTLLVKRREDLRLGDLIPVGDLWDEIAAGDQPFSEGMRIEFDNAKKLWTQKLLPMLEAEHDVTWQDLQEGRADPGRARLFQNDARLLKTLLLAALVPETPALKALTAPRLAALNHGTVISPVPGREGGLVLQKLRAWASRVGEIRISEDQTPIVSLQITGVDVEPILANAAPADNDGARRSRLQKILFEALATESDGPLLGAQAFIEYQHPWRGTKRRVDLYFEVVKELSHERLRGRPGAPVLVLGMPFDPRGRALVDHLAHVRDFDKEDAAGGVVWQPSYLSDRALRDLGTLVRIDYLLAGAGDRLNEAARMLSAGDREQARAVLKSQQSALHQHMRLCLEAAYGIRPDADGCLGSVLPAEDRLVGLDTFGPQTPVGATMKDAVSSLLDGLFADRYPAHPKFDQDVKPAALRRVLEEVQKAALETDQRIFVADRAVRQILAGIAGPLMLGNSSQTHFMLSSHWAQHFARLHARSGAGEPLTVGRLRSWLDEPKAMGLTLEVQNLVILAFVAQADRILLRDGAPAQASLERIDDRIEVAEQRLPDEEAWARARERAAALFGLSPGEVRKGATLTALAADLKAKAAEARPLLSGLLGVLKKPLADFGVGEAASRLITARSSQSMVSDLLASADSLTTVTSFAAAELSTSEAAVSRCLGSAGALTTAITATEWEIISSAAGLTDHRQAAAQGLRTKMAEALEADEHSVPLAVVLRDIQGRASRLLADTGARAPPSGSPGEPPAPSPPATPPLTPIAPADEEFVEERQTATLAADEAKDVLDALGARVATTPGARLALSWRLTRPAGGGEA